MSEREKLKAVMVETMRTVNYSGGVYEDKAAYLLAAIEAAGARLVPSKATYEMMVRGAREQCEYDNPDSDGGDAAAIYCVMIAASPYAAKRAQLIDGDERTTVRIFTPYASE